MRTLALNLKAYPESSGAGGYRLARVAGVVAKNVASLAGVRIVLAPQTPDLAWFARELHGTGCAVFAQHADAVEPGARTGALTLDALKASGCAGTLLNHSERRVNSRHLAFIARRAREVRLDTLFCAKSAREAARNARLYSPSMVAFEEPRLIGGDVSVATAEPAVVRSAVQAVRKANPRCPVLVGAGVHSAADVRRSVELGADGVLLAHAYVNAKDPEAFLKDLVLALGAKR